MGQYDVAIDTKLSVLRGLRSPEAVGLLADFIEPAWWKANNLRRLKPIRELTEDLIGFIEDVVNVGRTYFISSEMCQVVKAAANKLDEFVLYPEDIPTKQGFVYFESLVESSGAEEIGLDIPLRHRAAAWDASRDNGQVSVYWFTSVKDTEDFLIQSMKEGQDRDDFLKYVKKYLGYWYCSGIATLDFEKPYDTPLSMSGHMQLAALWLLMAQRATEEEDEPIHRKERKRAVRGGLDGEINKNVSVVYLRGMRHHAEARFAEGKTGRLTYRFPVSGHWRNQWYPKAQRHRKKWIAPYIKGPQDGELKINEKVTVFRDKG